MRSIRTLFVLLLSVPFFAVNAQTQAVIPLSSEPHHHLVFHNQYMDVYQVEVAPNDSVLLHRHNLDVLAVTIGDTHVTVGIPGKPDAPQQLTDGQLRLQPRGYVHSTHIDGPGMYRAVAVELLVPQSNGFNRCAGVIAGKPLACGGGLEKPIPLPTVATGEPKGYIDLPQYESDQTLVILVRVKPHQSAPIGSLPQLLVALGDAVLAPADGKGPSESLHAGSIHWVDAGGPAHIFKNDTDKEARFLLFVPKTQSAAKADRTPSK